MRGLESKLLYQKFGELQITESKNPERVGVGSYMETWLADYLEWEIRQLYGNRINGLKVHVIYSQMKTEHSKDGLPSFDYFERGIMVTQDQSGMVVPVFALYCQEFEDGCQRTQNEGRVYVSYLDSTPYYQPPTEGKGAGISCFQQLLNGYLRYASALGFTTAHIWSCAPSDPKKPWYIFKGAVKSIKDQKQLDDWYKKLLDRGAWDFEFIEKMLSSDSYKAELPYFPGDVKQISSVSSSMFIVDITTCDWYGKCYEKRQEFTSEYGSRANVCWYDYSTEKKAADSLGKLLSQVVSDPAYQVNATRIPLRYNQGL